MNSKKNWDELPHEEKLNLLRDESLEDLVKQFCPPELDKDSFKTQLAVERNLWHPENIRETKIAGEVPSKSMIIGSWRDLNRAEAFMELIDNSVDAWLRRKEKYPREISERLQIYIDIERKENILTYEDNAGGVEEDKLVNLVIPGHSETDDMEKTIGSYRTGGKKAIFKLAQDASIQTRYWNPVGTSDEAFEIHLDHNWLSHPTEYKFPYHLLNDKTVLQRGQTIYRFRIRDEFAGARWFEEPQIVEDIAKEIQRVYTLLLIRHPEIEIYFLNRSEPLRPLQDFYKFSGTLSDKIDLRPQRINFKCDIEWEGRRHDIIIEIVLGCRTTTATKHGEDIWGIDFYGNNRLFFAHDQENFSRWFSLTTGGSRHLIRGFVNVHAPNIFIPWDTHKRHLNADREVVNTLQKNRLIRDFFDMWNDTYKDISKLPNVLQTVGNEITPWKKDKDLHIPFSKDISISSKRKKGESLPKDIHRPKVLIPSSREKPITIKFEVTRHEFRELCSRLGISGSFDDKTFLKDLSLNIKGHLLGRKKR